MILDPEDMETIGQEWIFYSTAPIGTFECRLPFLSH